MVRFSDIIKSNGEKSETKRQPEPMRQEEGFRLSDSRVLKIRSLDASPSKKVQKSSDTVEVGKYYRAFIDRARETGQWIKNDMQISPAPILSDLHAVIEKDLIDNLYEHTMTVNKDEEDIFTHAVDVTVTSLRMGKGMDYDLKMMLKLGLAAFLENVGMYKIPADKLSFKGKLSNNEMALIRKLPQTSYNILLTLGDRYTWLAETVLRIHERSDGSGYPFGLKETQIPELSAVIGLADIYCAMIGSRPYRDNLTRAEAVKSIIETDKRKFPSKILKLFLNQISLFPVNSYVKLNNGSIGRVLFTNIRHPLSPVVELVYNGKQKKLKNGKKIALTDDPLLYIVRNIDPYELAR